MKNLLLHLHLFCSCKFSHRKKKGIDPSCCAVAHSPLDNSQKHFLPSFLLGPDFSILLMRYLFILLETTLTCNGVGTTCVISLHSEHKMEIDTSISVLIGPPPARLQLLLISRPFSRFFLLHRRVVCVRRRHLTFSAARQWRWRRLMIHHQAALAESQGWEKEKQQQGKSFPLFHVALWAWSGEKFSFFAPSPSGGGGLIFIISQRFSCRQQQKEKKRKVVTHLILLFSEGGGSGGSQWHHVRCGWYLLHLRPTAKGAQCVVVALDERWRDEPRKEGKKLISLLLGGGKRFGKFFVSSSRLLQYPICIVRGDRERWFSIGLYSCLQAKKVLSVYHRWSHIDLICAQ